MADSVLVTGGTGFLGGHCIAQLLKRGYDVRTTVRSRPASPRCGRRSTRQESMRGRV